MSNELANMDDDGTIEVLPPARPPSSVARTMLAEHTHMMHDASQLAAAMVRTTMVPKRFFGKQGDATAAILYGAELGLNPIQSLQRVIPIHGMPSLEARTMVGLLKAKGYRIRTDEQSAESVTVSGTAPDGETATSTWTIGRAIIAGYVPIPSSPDSLRRPNVEGDWETITKTWEGRSKKSVVGNMKYITDPQAMLKAKAQAEVCRELAPDVLMGISYTREDLESERPESFDREPRVETPKSKPVTVGELFAEEVALPTETPDDDEDQDAEPEQTPTESPSPSEPPAAVPDEPAPAPEPEPEADPVVTDAEVAQAAQDRETKAKSKTIAAKRSTAPGTNPDRPKSRMRQALEKRLFALLGDAGINGEADRDGRLAVYRVTLDDPKIGSTDDLDDARIGKVADQLYAWQQQNVLVEKVEGILSDTALAETTAAPAADPHQEGNQ